MPDNRLTLTIEAQNQASQAFQAFRQDVAKSNELLNRIASNTERVRRETVKLTDSQQIIKRLRSEYNHLRTDIHNTAAVTRQFAKALQSQIRSQVAAAASLERLRVGLVSIAGSAAAAEQQYARLIEVSRLPGINIENSLRATLQLQALGKSGEDAAEVIREFGNALALSGTAPRELNQVVNAIRQMSGEGKILQEDIAILTTRVAALVPHLKEAFGGTRAKDVREFFDALGVDESQQADRFLRIVLDRLKELPRAGETASNAIENLGDTTQRLQAAIGANFLPVVKQATGALEGLLMEIEREPQLARTIAILEALGGTFLTVTAAGVGLAAALPALIAAIASLGAPILVPIAIVGGLTAALVPLKVASQDIETQIEQLAATFDELDEALRKNHEAIQSNQQAQVESAKSSLTIQRDAIQQHITLLEEERASIERSIEANRKRAEQGLLPIASTGESFGKQLDNANARLKVTQQRLQEVNDALRANEEAAVPIQKATVNIDTLTKAVTRLKEELEEETTFERISQGITGDPASFRQSAQALADIEVLVRVNADRFKELRDAAAGGNQEAATALAKLNQEFEGLRDTQADRHVDNLSAAFDELNQSTNVTSSQLADVLQATQAFANAFQGTGGLIQDDVARAAELIDDIQARLNSVRQEEQLPKRQRRKSQADEEPESQIERITEQRQAELQAQVDVARELFQIRKDIREAENQAEIDAAEEQATALLRVNGRFVSQFIELRGLITDEAIAQSETLRDQSLALLANEVEERQALYEDDLKSQRQVEQAKRQENEKTYDYDALLTDLRTKNRQAAAQEFVRLEGRALDISSQSQRENLIRETQQFADAYAERSAAFRDLVQDAQDLGTELQEAFDLTEQQKRLEDFQDSVAGVLDNLAGIAIDHIFDSFGDSAQRATDAVGTFVDEVRGELQLLQGDITRLTRFDEDQGTRRERLEEDRDRRLAQLQRQRQALASRAPAGDQRGIERNTQRQQDLTSRITQLREDFAVRLSRFDEDSSTRRSRTIEDATQRRENFESRGSDEGLISKLVGSLGDTLSSKITSALASGLAGLLAGALENPFKSLIDGIQGLFGGGDGQPDQGPPTQPGGQDAQQQIQPEITAPTEPIAIKGKVDLSLMDINLPTEAVDLTGRIGTIEELSESVKLPPVPGLTGGIGRLVLPPGVDRPIVPGLTGEIAQIQLAEGLTLPTLPALRIPVIYDIPDLPVGRVDVGPLEVIGPPAEPTDETPAPATPAPATPALTGTLNIPIENITLPTESLILSAAIALMATDITPPAAAVDLQGAINLLSSDIAAPPLPIPLQGVINADLNKTFTEPIALAGIINATVHTPDLPEGRVEVGPLEVVGPPGETPTPAPTAELIPGIINAELNKLFDEPVQIAGVVNARTNIAASGGGGPVGGQFRSNDTDEDPENPQLDIGDLEGEIDSLKISEAAKALIEPVLLEGEINATLLKLFPEPVLIDGIINARINYATGAEPPAGGGEGGTGQQAPRIGEFDPQTPGEPAGQGFNLNPDGGLVANRNAGGGGGGNAIQVSLPKSTLNAIAQEKTLLEMQAGFRSQFQETNTYFSNIVGGLTSANRHLSGIRRALLSDDTPQIQLSTEATLQTLATESTLSALSSTLAQIQLNTERIADAPLVQGLLDAGVEFPNDPLDPTNAAFTQSPIQDILSQGGLSLFANFDKIDRNLQTLLDAQSQAQGTPDLSVMPGADPSNPMYAHIVNQTPVQDVRVVNDVRTKAEITNKTLDTNVVNTVGVKQVGTFAVTQGGEFVVQLAGGGTLPVYVQGGRLSVDIEGGLEGLAVQLADEEVRLNAVGAL